MLTAQDENGQRFILQREHTTDYLKRLREEHQFSCEICHEPVTLKVGTQVTPHFAHKPHTQCEGENEPESPDHREGKWSLYQWLENQGETPIIEQYFPTLKQRADIGLPDRQWIIEYQCSPITPTRFNERTSGYLSKNLYPIWILGANRLQRYSRHIYKWMQTDQLMVQVDRNQNAPYVIFFNGKSSEMTFLFHFWSLNTSAVICDEYTIKTSDFNTEQLLALPMPKPKIEEMQLDWLKQKEKWRTLRTPHPSKLERYVQTICQSQGLSITFFPSYVGLPIIDDLVIASPTYLWQAWLVLQFFYQQPIGSVVHLSTIENSFLRLVDKKVIALRSGKRQITTCLRQYLNALERFLIIKRGKHNQYTLERTVEWHQQSLSDFILEDAAALWRWVELDC